MSLAATKRRIKRGSKLELVRHDRVATGGIVVHGNLGTTRLQPKIAVGMIREVGLANSKEFTLLTPDAIGGFRESYMTWPLASNYRDTPDGFELDLNGTGDFRECIGYRFA